MRKFLILGVMVLMIGLLGCGGSGGSNDDGDNPPPTNNEISSITKVNIGSDTKYLFLKNSSSTSSTSEATTSSYGNSQVLYQVLQNGTVQQVDFYDAQDAIVNMYGTGFYAYYLHTTKDVDYFIVVFMNQTTEQVHSVLIRVSDGAVYYVGNYIVYPSHFFNYDNMFTNEIFGYTNLNLGLWNMLGNRFLQTDGSGNIYYNAYDGEKTTIMKISTSGTIQSQPMTSASENCNQFIVDVNGNLLAVCYVGSNYASRNYKIRRISGSFSTEAERLFLKDLLSYDDMYGEGSASVFVGSNGKINYTSLIDIDMSSAIFLGMFDHSLCYDTVDILVDWNDYFGSTVMPINYLDPSVTEITSGVNYTNVDNVLTQSVVISGITSTVTSDMNLPIEVMDVTSDYILYFGATRTTVVEYTAIDDDGMGIYSHFEPTSVIVNSDSNYCNNLYDGNHATPSLIRVGLAGTDVQVINGIVKFIDKVSYNDTTYMLAKTSGNKDTIRTYTLNTNSLNTLYTATNSDIEIFSMEVDSNGVFVHALNQLTGETIYGKITSGTLNILQTTSIGAAVDLIRIF